jgi:hypothetical protein
MTHFRIATAKLKPLPPTKMISTPIKTSQQVELDSPVHIKSIPLLDIGLSTREATKRIGIFWSIVRQLKCCPCPRSQHNMLCSWPKFNKRDICSLIGILQSGWEGKKLSGKNWPISRFNDLRKDYQIIKQGDSYCKACRKPFISRITQHERIIYAMIRLHKLVEFWRLCIYILG